MKKSRFSSCQKDISSILNRLNTTVLVISLFVLTAVNLLFIYVSTVKIMTTILKEQAKTEQPLPVLMSRRFFQSTAT